MSIWQAAALQDLLVLRLQFLPQPQGILRAALDAQLETGGFAGQQLQVEVVKAL